MILKECLMTFKDLQRLVQSQPSAEENALLERLGNKLLSK
jgi:hypothetical protein